jgi:anaerobic magnesium-protoporphyrin IX monomethyl ester cyclase
LKQKTNIHIHLDLIAGLPGETYPQFLKSIDQVASFRADHLQIELVKLLPGAPLRKQVKEWGICFDPAPPYTILTSQELTFFDLDRLSGIGRLFDLMVNSGRFEFLLPRLTDYFKRLSLVLEDLDTFWREENLYNQRRSLRDLYLRINDYLSTRFSGDRLAELQEILSRDYAHNERVVGGSAPLFFNVDLNEIERDAVRKQVKEAIAGMERCGKIQYFSAVYHHLPDSSGRTILTFLYTAKTVSGSRVRELVLH